MNFSTTEPDGHGDETIVIFSAIYLANPGGVPQYNLSREQKVRGKALYGSMLSWLTHRQISSGSGLSELSRCAQNEPLEACSCVCSCPWACKKRVSRGGQEKTGINRFPWLARCRRQSFLDTQTFIFFAWLCSQSMQACSHASICAMPHRAKYLQCSGFHCLALHASVQPPPKQSPNRQIEKHTNFRQHPQANTSSGLNWTAAAPLLKGEIIPVNPISSLIFLP